MVPILPILFKVATVATAVLVPTFGALGARHVNRSWKLRDAQAKEDQLAAFAYESALNSYQQFKDVADKESRHKQKLETALETLMASASSAGIELSDKRARPKIEAAVTRLKREQEAASTEAARVAAASKKSKE